MKLRIFVIILGSIFAAVIGALFMFNTRSTAPKTALPSPNGYDDFAAAGQWLVTWNGDLPTLRAEEVRSVVTQNAKTLETVHEGLKRPSAVPVTNDMNWFNQHMVQLTTHKQIAQLLVAEGTVHLEERHTNEAARSFASCIRFAHAAHRQGLMIDELVAIACQAIGSRQLVQLAPHLSPDAVREILLDLIALDRARETTGAIVQRDSEWSRGAYGLWRSILMRMVTRKGLRAAEASFKSKHARSVAELRLVIAELAVRGHQTKNGKPPMALAELVPAWLPAVPLDPFSKGPLVYRVTNNSFLLYSVGPDGHDDQGTPLKRGEMETGDLLPTGF
jgi:hypothetical protein